MNERRGETEPAVLVIDEDEVFLEDRFTHYNIVGPIRLYYCKLDYFLFGHID